MKFHCHPVNNKKELKTSDTLMLTLDEMMKLKNNRLTAIATCAAVVFSAAVIYGVVKDDLNDPVELSFNKGELEHQHNDIAKASMAAQAMLLNTFKTVPKFISVDTGPSQTWVFHVQIDGKDRTFFLLPDGQNLIEGNLLTSSKNIPPPEIHLQHQATATALDSRELKNEFLAKVGKSVDKSENDVTDKPVKQPTNTEQHLPFKLPERNTILTSKDKALFFDRTEELEFIEVGNNDAPMVYVYFDFNCPGCRIAKKALNEFTESNQLRVRYIPVGVIQQESAIKAAYSIIPKSNNDRTILLDYFSQNKSADELIQKKAPKDRVLKALASISESNKTFMFTPKKLTPVFTFKLNGEVVIANLTSKNSIKDMVERLNKQEMSL